MKYVYKEPTTWAELFDALAAVDESIAPCRNFRVEIEDLNPKNLSQFIEVNLAWRSQYQRLWCNVVSWWYDSYYIMHDRHMPFTTYNRRYHNYPTKRDIAALRKFLKELLEVAHYLYAQ